MLGPSSSPNLMSLLLTCVRPSLLTSMFLTAIVTCNNLHICMCRQPIGQGQWDVSPEDHSAPWCVPGQVFMRYTIVCGGRARSTALIMMGGHHNSVNKAVQIPMSYMYAMPCIIADTHLQVTNRHTNLCDALCCSVLPLSDYRSCHQQRTCDVTS